MNALNLKSRQGRVSISKGQKGLIFQIPQGMNGMQFSKFVADNAIVLDELKASVSDDAEGDTSAP